MSANNSISQLLEQFIELYNNSLSTFEKTNEAITTDKETVAIDLYDPKKGSVKTVQIPSFGFLKREIERLNGNLDALAGTTSTTSNVKLKDGSFRRIITSKLQGPAPSITNLAAPTAFKTKANEFFEDFLNPLLTVSLNVNGQIPTTTEKAHIERYIFDSNDVNSIQAFNSLYKGLNNIDYDTFIKDIAQNKYVYRKDASDIDMPSRSMTYYGNFDVLGIDTAEKTLVVDGTTQTVNVRLFTLNQLTYSDSSKTLKNTETLKVGDFLVVNSNQYSTRYKITALNTDTLQAELDLIEGSEPIRIGAGELKIYKDVDVAVNIDVNVAFNEYQVVFVKAIDSVSKILSESFSPGVAFYSNELQIATENGTVMNLADYYRLEVADFGQFIKSFKIDSIPPASVGLVPNAPTLDTANFKVVQINKHLTDNDSTNKIKQLKNDKLASEQNLKKLDDAISKKKSSINTVKYKSTVERDRDTNELSTLAQKRTSESSLYSSVVSEIKSIANSNNLSNIAPKYKLRGFWSIPEPKSSNGVVEQAVVQFKIRYRYVSSNGKTSQIDQIPFQDGNTTKTAAFSNWIEVDGPVRKRIKDASGKFYWGTDSEEDANAINFNSLDITIQPGEKVEIMIKSLSEAGFPANSIESDWSDIMTYEFPEGEFTGDTILEAVNENSLETVRIQITQDLTTAGLYTHLDDSFTANSKYFSHNATSIASGFLTTEQNPVSLFDKLVEMQTQIEKLKAQIAGTLGELIVYIEDETGAQTSISNHTTVKLFAGYYVDEITNQIDRKGAIVTKSFKLKLSNSKATDLELIARLVGDRTKQAYASGASTVLGVAPGTIDPFISSDIYYANEGRYDLVPVQYQNISANLTSVDYMTSAPYQSGQLRGQFIYSRAKNLANDADLYSMTAPDTDYNVNTWTVGNGVDDFEYGIDYKFSANPALIGSGDSRYWNFTNATSTAYAANNGTDDFIWSGDYDVNGIPNRTAISTGTNQISKTAYDNGLFLHKDHPLLNTGSALTPLNIAETGLVSMSKNAPRRANMTDGSFQNPYKKAHWQMKSNTSTPIDVYRSLKMSFNAEDQFLLGGHSCGAYLFLSPIETTSLVVDADNKFGKKSIAQGATNAVSIDLIFQYRMTDYFGVTSANNSGRVGGIASTNLTNLTYSKKIGLDILKGENDIFSFDIEVYAKYKPEGSSVANVTKEMIDTFRVPGLHGGRAFVDSENDFSTPGSITSLRYM
jgi:peptidyl-tRNA hydrolase